MVAGLLLLFFFPASSHELLVVYAEGTITIVLPDTV